MSFVSLDMFQIKSNDFHIREEWSSKYKNNYLKNKNGEMWEQELL